ncbi:hypothetical protein G7Y89_g10715 [Cudoniella acicularis]|uniref:Uncharacterized protein n=1 Tax=Cudoniella acicularis TaxID=354080 RepID=A0A8H4RC76_9HELO|nr:hypothetical protein G7Y89_g10715 [Cudoniella acicularis]
MKGKALLVPAFLAFGGLLALISYYHWSGANAAGQSNFIRNIYGFLRDRNIHRKTPYARLLKGSSAPQDLILLPTWQSPLSAVIRLLRRHHYLTAIVSAISLPTEFLPLLLTNIPFSFGTIKLAYTICNHAVMAILTLMIITTVVLIFRKPSGVGGLLRKPDNLASVAVYLAGEGDKCIFDSFAGLSVVRKEERDSIVKDIGVVYSPGFVDDAMEEVRINDDLRVRSLWPNAITQTGGIM